MKTFFAVLSVVLTFARLGGVRAASAPEMVVQNSHNAEVKSIRFSRDGHFALSVTWGELKLWNPDTGELIRTWNEAPEIIFAAEFSPDGKTIVIGSAEKGLSLWDVETGLSKGKLTADEGFGSVRFSPDGKWLLGAGGDSHVLNGKIFIWNWQNHQLIRTVQGEKSDMAFGIEYSVANHMGITSDSKEVWLRTYDKLSWWRLSDGKNETTLDVTRYTEAIPSPDGKTVAKLTTYGNIIELVERKSKRILWVSKDEEVESRFMAEALNFSPNGGSLVETSTQANVFRIIDTKTGKLTREWGSVEDFSTHPEIIAFAPNERRLAFAFQLSGTVRFTSWPKTGPLTAEVGPPNLAVDYAATRDGHMVAWLRDDAAISFWDVIQGKEVRMLVLNPPGTRNEQRFEDLELSPDGATVYVQSRRELRAIDTKTGEEMWHRFNYGSIPQPKDPEKQREPEFTSLSLSEDGKVLASLYDEGPLRCWDARTGRWLMPASTEREPKFTFYQSVRLSPDGKWAAINGMYDPDVVPPKNRLLAPLLLMDVATQQIIREIPETGGRPLRFSPNGKILLVSEHSDQLSAYDVQTLKRRWQTTGPATGFFESNDKFFCMEADDTYNERAVSDGKVLKSWKDQSHLSFTRSLRKLGTNRIIGFTGNQTMAIWDLTTHRKILDMAIPALSDSISHNWLAYTPDNFYNGSPGVEKFLRWRTGTKLENGAKWRAHFYSPEKVQAALAFRP